MKQTIFVVTATDWRYQDEYYGEGWKMLASQTIAVCSSELMAWAAMEQYEDTSSSPIVREGKATKELLDSVSDYTELSVIEMELDNFLFQKWAPMESTNETPDNTFEKESSGKSIKW